MKNSYIPHQTSILDVTAAFRATSMFIADQSAEWFNITVTEFQPVEFYLGVWLYLSL